MSSRTLYQVRDLCKRYQAPGETIQVLKGIDLDVLQGESLAIMGASGSGKTTLLHLLGTLDTPSDGKIEFNGRDITSLDATARASIRNSEIGFVFQLHHLLPEFNTLENVAMPGLIKGMARERALEKAAKSLALVGMEQRERHSVTTLSGGERQRASIARAIFMEPRVLLADEPTGSLDEKTGRLVGDLMLSLNSDFNMTLIVVTHNGELARNMGRRLELISGELHAHPL
ncbi:MAG: ABC transporter ATP-binding protein [Desulfovibrio sp.]|uniref:ABC transporter ATP-binding protein n=1 Tax=Desulfovibrio sp. 7SRBS1 TaxID=3378064 RepID=UPI003B3D5517